MMGSGQEPAPFRILAPQRDELPLVIGIPHTGTELPDEIMQRLRPEMRDQPMCDWHLHQLYAHLTEIGITLVHSVYSRFLADLNRPPDASELYPGRFETGLVPTQTFKGEPIWERAPSPDEIDAWRERFHTPYHAALSKTLDERSQATGRVWFVDAHSVASTASLLHGALEDEIYLGDRDGTSNEGAWTDAAASGFTSEGYRVVRNAPYKGGYNTAHYGARDRVEALQVEMCQRCYMDEMDPAGGPEHPRFQVMQDHLRDIFSGLATHIRQEIDA
jgi:N-formylglutamate deformylase